MSEDYFIDPPEEIADRTELRLTPIMMPAGVDWPASTYQPFWGDADVGQVEIGQGQWLNREVSIPLVLKDTAGTAFATWRSSLQGKVGEIQRAKFGVLKRVMSSGGTVCADILSARLKLGGDWAQAHKSYDVNVTLELVLSPESYGEWVTLDEISATDLRAGTDIAAVLREDGVTATIAGDFPPGNRCRVVATENTGVDKRGLIAAFRKRHYDSAATAALILPAEALTPRDAASARIVTPGSGSLYPRPGSVVNCIRHIGIGATWTPVLDTTLLVGGDLTHTGTYRVLARVLTGGDQSLQVRMMWDVGDFVAPTTNAPWTIPKTSFFPAPFIADLGQVTIERAPSGTHRWVGQVQAKGTAGGGEEIYVDAIILVPLDEFAALVSATPDLQPGIGGYLARDGFQQTAGALAGKTLSFGGTWSVAGDADDFNVDTVTATAKRSATSDTPTFPGGHFALASGSANMADQAASIDFKVSAYNSGITSGLLLRYVDINNWFMLWQTLGALGAIKSVARTLTFMSINSSPATAGLAIPAASPVDTFQRLSAAATADGVFYGAIGPGESKLYQFTGVDSALATGGVLARGSAGFYDANGGVTAIDRYYDNFCCWTPTKDAVVFANQSAELRTDGLFRADSTGTSWGPMQPPVGNLPRLPNGADDSPVEVLLKLSRGDLGTLPDPLLDAQRLQVSYRPCWLGVPDA